MGEQRRRKVEDRRGKQRRGGKRGRAARTGDAALGNKLGNKNTIIHLQTELLRLLENKISHFSRRRNLLGSSSGAVTSMGQLSWKENIHFKRMKQVNAKIKSQFGWFITLSATMASILFQAYKKDTKQIYRSRRSAIVEDGQLSGGKTSKSLRISSSSGYLSSGFCCSALSSFFLRFLKNTWNYTE